MADDIYTPDERRLLEAWFDGKSISIEDEDLVAEWGFDHESCAGYTRLDAWVGRLRYATSRSGCPTTRSAAPTA